MGIIGDLSILDNSPIPCLWFSFDKIDGNLSGEIKIIGRNKKLRDIIGNSEFEYIYTLDKEDTMKFTKTNFIEENSVRIIKFVSQLNSFYEMDIYKIDDNLYLVWFSKKIYNDEVIQKISDNTLLNLISDTIPDSIFVKDKDGIFIHCNKVFANNRNLSKEQVIGKSEEDINTPKEKIEKYKKEEKEIEIQKESKISMHSFVDKNGKTRYYETIKVPLLDNNMVMGGVLGISRDITLRKESEFEYENLKMQFFSNLSHEFKTPLNLIFSSTQLIEYMIDKGEDVSKYKKYTNIIKQNGYRLLKMANNLIDDTRLSIGCLEFWPENYDIVKFIENICDSLQCYAKEEKVELVFDTELEEKIMAFDLEKMDRIMLNLLSNAIKYSKEKGKIEVVLKFTETELFINIKDNGSGIKKEILDDVFVLFNQEHNHNTKTIEGRGIGLSIVKSLVDLHKGKIEAKSEKGIGSEFVVRLPISLCENDVYEKKYIKYNKYVENVDIELSDIYAISK